MTTTRDTRGRKVLAGKEEEREEHAQNSCSATVLWPGDYELLIGVIVITRKVGPGEM